MFLIARLGFPVAVGLIAAVSITGCSSSDSDMDAEPAASVSVPSLDSDTQADDLTTDNDETGDDEVSADRIFISAQGNYKLNVKKETYAEF